MTMYLPIIKLNGATPILLTVFETGPLVPNEVDVFLLLALGFPQLDSQVPLLTLLALFTPTTFSRTLPPSQHSIQTSRAGIFAMSFLASTGEFYKLEIKKTRYFFNQKLINNL